jgi:hypothetical protein
MITNTLILALTNIFFILMWFLEIRNTKSLKKKLREERESQFIKKVKRYDRHFKFINVDIAGDNLTLNKMVKSLEEEGYKYNHSENPCNGILAFIKYEEVIENEKEDQVYRKESE